MDRAGAGACSAGSFSLPAEPEGKRVWIEFDGVMANSDVWLNCRNLKIKGVCLHQDAGLPGTAVPMDAWERRLKILQSLGVNAIRTARTPVAPGFLDLCDRLGLLVMDESFDCWTKGKNAHDHHLYFDQWSLTDLRASRRIGTTEKSPADPGYQSIDWKRHQVLFPDRTPADTATHEEGVEVHSNDEEVELFLNDQSLGTRAASRIAAFAKARYTAAVP